jgi:hypothetical protein
MAKLTGLIHKIAIQLHLVQRAVPFAVLAPGGKFGKFWIHPRMQANVQKRTERAADSAYAPSFLDRLIITLSGNVRDICVRTRWVLTSATLS